MAPATETPELEPSSVEASVGDPIAIQACEPDAQLPPPASVEAAWEAPAAPPSSTEAPPAQAPPEHTGSALDPAPAGPEAETLLEFSPFQEDSTAPFATDVRL
jgi:hypothetical protein